MTVEDIMTLIRDMADESVIRKAIDEALDRAFNEGYDNGLVDGQEE